MKVDGGERRREKEKKGLQLTLLFLFLLLNVGTPQDGLQCNTVQEKNAVCTDAVSSAQKDKENSIACSKVALIIAHGSYDSYAKTIQPHITALQQQSGCTCCRFDTIVFSQTVPDLSVYTQVWVYWIGSNVDSLQYEAEWKKISTWYLQNPKRHIICDGRILSSLGYAGVTAKYQIYKNYYVNLRERGGGLLLGSDDTRSLGPDDYRGWGGPGLNFITKELLIGAFYGNNPGPTMPVDGESPLMSYPAQAADV